MRITAESGCNISDEVGGQATHVARGWAGPECVSNF